MNVTVFSALAFERPFLEQANAGRHQVQFYEQRLTDQTRPLAQGALAVSVFGSDDLSAPVLAQLWAHGVRYVLVRATGTDNVDLPAAHRLGLCVASVPDYSPHAIAEHTVALLLALARHLRRANQQVRPNAFCLNQLVGFELRGKTVGIVGVGHIGAVLAGILHGFGCRLLGEDLFPTTSCASATASSTWTCPPSAPRPTSSACTRRLSPKPTTCLAMRCWVG
ncbi:hypothetical protein GCM10027422_47160 [Hymenobacter arcticus]